MGRPNHVKERFAHLLRSALTTHFGGHLPSNAVIAREFNLRAHGAEPVTHESVRRWIHGISMPDETKLRALTVWLDLDLRDCFHSPSADATALHEPKSSGKGRQKTLNGQQTNGHTQGDQARLLQLINNLSDADRSLIEQLTKKLFQQKETTTKLSAKK